MLLDNHPLPLHLSERVTALIPAAGVGSRMKAAIPKQYLPLLGDRTMLEITAARLAEVVGADRVLIAVSAEDGWISGIDLADMQVLRTGGSTRAATVTQTLEAALASHCIEPDELVLVHDAARPLVDPDEVRELIAATRRAITAGSASGAVLAMPVSDTVKRADAEGILVEDVDRTGLFRIATPQCFAAGELLAALRAHPDVTDESSAIRAAGGRVLVVRSTPANIKVTEPADADFARERLATLAAHGETSQSEAKKENAMQIRVGLGYDSHRLEACRKFILGGVEIAHDRGLAGHSDADALLHAITDAVLGAAGLGNIGILFPDNDPAFKDADSKVLLRRAWEKVSGEGWRIGNLDCVVIAQKPKLNPHVTAMAQCIAKILDTDAALVSIKPKTNEKLGFEGREEGISTQAAVLLIKD